MAIFVLLSFILFIVYQLGLFLKTTRRIPGLGLFPRLIFGTNLCFHPEHCADSDTQSVNYNCHNASLFIKLSQNIIKHEHCHNRYRKRKKCGWDSPLLTDEPPIQRQ